MSDITGCAARPARRHDPRDTIRLGQLLKLAGLADSGGDARELVRRARRASTARSRRGAGASCTRGDVVTVAGESVRIA